MAINKGNIKTSVNYNLEAQKPLDARSVRPTKADLYKKESWSYDGDSVYIYNGMLVYVEDEKKTYCLVDETKYDKESGWELVGTGASSGGGGSIKEVYVGPEKPEDESVEIWIDTDEDYPEGGGNSGSTVEPELRPLYVPNLNAGSTLTDSQIAYNEETCQKMLNGAAIAIVTDGTISSYSDNIIDLTPQGAEGYVVHFKGVGGVYVIGGDVMVTLPDVSTSATIPIDITAENAADITNLVIAIAIAGSLGSLPACYLEKGGLRHLFKECGVSSGVLILHIEYYDASTRVSSTYLLAGDGSGGEAITFRFPTKIYLDPTNTEKENNVDWMKNRHAILNEVPTLKYGEIEYYPISIDRYATYTGYADFTIYRDGFETWRMMDDGSTTKL